MENTKLFETIKKTLIFLSFFLFPLFFLPQFTNVFGVPKIVLLTIMILALILLKAVETLVKKRLVISNSPFDSSLYLLLVAYVLSLIIVSPNKIEALMDPSRGVLLVVLLAFLVLFSSQEKKIVLIAQASSAIGLLIITLLSYFGAFKNMPTSLAFMSTKGFTPIGNFLDLAGFFLFYLGLSIPAVFEKKGTDTKNKPERLLLNLLLASSVIGLGFALFVLIKDIKPIFVPLTVAWQVAVEGLKNFTTVIFGVGPANYLSLFTVAKPVVYNTYPALWQVGLEYSQSAFLQIFSEVGLLGFTALTIILLQVWREARKIKLELAFLALIIWGVFFSLSTTYFFLFFVLILLFRTEKTKKEVDLKELDVVRYGVSSCLVAIVVASGYFLFKFYYSDYLLQASFNAAQKNEVQKMYDLQKQATITNIYSEKARLSFGQTNMLLANNISQKKDLTDADKQNIAALIQQGIAEGKELVRINPQKANYWANLAEIYRLIIGVAQGADAWSISAYQRAIALDRNNPTYYFNLGSIYFMLGNFEESSKFYEQTLGLKPDVANYAYNLAWSYAKNNNYLKAVNAMELALQGVKKDSDDYKKASKELEEFKSMLPKEEVNENQNLQPETLTQPSPMPSVSPEIKLPKESAPAITDMPTLAPSVTPKAGE